MAVCHSRPQYMDGALKYFGALNHTDTSESSVVIYHWECAT